LQSRQGYDEIKTREEKIRSIGIILGLLEETHRNKSWILKELKKHDMKTGIKSSMNCYEMLSCCSTDFINSLMHTLKGNDIAAPEKVETKIYHWFFSDIVAGSNPSIPTKAQVQKIIALNELISRTKAFKERDPSTTIILPTGDGMAIGFGDSPEKPILLSIEIYKSLVQYNQSRRGNDKLLLRIGIESGPVYFVKDLEGKDNVWGPGIIVTRRVMDLCGDMQIFAATRIAEELVRISPKYKEMLHFVENYETRYGEKIQLYNVYGEGFGRKKAVTKPKKAINIQRKIKAASNFSFNEIKILVLVRDAKSMQTHHTWDWNLVNISKEPKEQISYYLDGQVPRDFSDLNVKVTDQRNKKLDIGEIVVNKPYRKEFSVKFDNPVLPREGITLRLEYDWEVPDRVILYKFPSGAKKFSFIGTLPKEVDLKNRILKVDPDTGFKVHATPPLTVRRSIDKTVITWSKRSVVPHDAYQFEW